MRRAGSLIVAVVAGCVACGPAEPAAPGVVVRPAPEQVRTTPPPVAAPAPTPVPTTTPSSGTGTGGPPAHVALVLPATGAFDYQLGGASPLPGDVRVVVRDSRDRPDPAAVSICYVNGFQSQPGESGRWLDLDVVLRDGDGRPVADPGWPDELLLDPTTPERRARIVAELGSDLRRCADAGFVAVELDNLDSWTRSGGRVTMQDALALATDLVAAAHGLGLAVAQKNAAELGTAGRDRAGFDFAITEECLLWDECAAYTQVYGDLVLDVEYTDDLPGTVEDVCAASPARGERPSLTIVRDRDLVPEGDPDRFFLACPR